MFRLRVVQAEFGDCLILEAGTEAHPHYVLIDGGPETIFDRHLRAELQKIAASGGSLDLVVLSHVDKDHIIGLLDFVAELRSQDANGETPTVRVSGLWHNSFAKTIGNDNDVQSRLVSVMGAGRPAMAEAGSAVFGIGEGNTLRANALALGIPINAGFSDDLITVDNDPEATVVGNLTLRVVGPTQANLDELKAEWIAWLDENEPNIASGDPFLMAMADRSVPNLSSIMLLAEAGGKRILLTGDGRGDHLLQGLKRAGLLGSDGGVHVDVLKLPHHGSDRNVTKKFFESVTADTYVASANGKDKNPDLATLIWIVEAAKKQSRRIRIFVTNRTPSVEQLLEDYPPSNYGYRLTTLKNDENSYVVAP